MLAHEGTTKNLLSKSKCLFEKNKEVVKENAKKMDAALQEVKDLNSLILNDNIVHNTALTYFIKTLVHYYDTKAHLSQMRCKGKK